MSRIGWAATLAGVVLILAGCRPAGPAPSDRATASPPTIEADAPVPDAQPEPAEDEADARSPWEYTPKTSEGRALSAVGKAVLGAVRGDTE